MSELTAPPPKPARAEPEEFRPPDTISLGGRTLKIAGRTIGGRGEFYDYAVRLTPEEIVAIAPTPNAGLAEASISSETVEAMLCHLLLAQSEVVKARDQTHTQRLPLFRVRDAANQKFRDAFAAQAATLAALLADNDRLRADAAGRGEVTAELRALSERATPGLWTMADGDNRPGCIVGVSTNLAIASPDVVLSATYSDRTHDEDRANMELALALVNDLRARIAAAPDPAPTDHSGDHHA